MTTAKARALFRGALAAGSSRDYQKATAILTDLISENDGPLEAFLLLGRSLHAQGRYGAAVGAFKAFADRGGDPGQAFFFSGRSLLSMGLPGRAAAALKRAVDLDPGSSQALGLFGYALLKLRRIQRAADVLEMAVKLAPADGRIYRAYLNALFVLGARKLAAGEADMARQLLSFATENGHEGIPPRIYLAQALSALGRHEEAIRVYDDILSRGPADPAIVLRKAFALAATGMADEAERLWASIRPMLPMLPEHLPGPKGFPLLGALADLERGDYRKAASQAVEGLRAEPRDPLLHAIAGEAYRNAGVYEKAINHFTRALEADPENVPARTALVSALWSVQDFPRLRKELKTLERSGSSPDQVRRYRLLLEGRTGEPSARTLRALIAEISERGPDPEIMELIASGAMDLGMHAVALPWYRRLLEEDAGRQDYLRAVIECLREAGPAEELEEAYIDYLSARPADSGLRREFADALFKVERWEEAHAQYEFLLPLEAEPAPLMRQMAFCLRKADRFREAAIIYRDLALADQEDKSAVKNLVYCLYRMDRADQAIAILDSARRHFGPVADMLLIQGWLLWKAGRTEASLDALRAATEKSPGDPEAWALMAQVHESSGSAESAMRCRAREADLRRAAQKRIAAPAAKAKPPASASPGPAKASGPSRRKAT